MRSLAGLVFVVLSIVVASAQEQAFDPGAYQSADGALTLSPGGNQVEPYFATKALLVAQDAGLDTRDAALKWIAWMLPRQRPDGRIDRWCRQGDSPWKMCGDADADDAMLALWAELLYRHATDHGPPLEWQQSVDKALAYEKGLRNRWGVFHISRKNHTPLFMDNVEIYSAFKDIGKQISRWNLSGAANMYAQSQELADAITRVFWNEAEGRFRPSTQKNKPGFYPDAVGQTYPWLENMPTPQDPQEGWKAWKQQYARGWLTESYDPHPWGLLALTALKLNDSITAGCWLQRSIARRGGANWNILEEATFQSLQCEGKLRRRQLQRPGTWPMKRKRLYWTLALCLLPLLLGVREFVSYGADSGGTTVDTLYLLVPDDIAANHPVVREWMDAAEEEGLHLSPLHDSEFLNPLQRSRTMQGLIVPDLVHRSANATLIGALHEYVHNGGNLMVVYDACTWDLDNHFARIQSRLSDLVGVSYAMYDRYHTDSIHWSSVWGDAEAMKDLGIPPGKFVKAGPGDNDGVKTVALTDEPGDARPKDGQLVLSRYEYGNLSYPAFRTMSDFDGKVLLHTSGGVAAGVRKDNLGHVMFVNLPLGYLESRTDGLLMHSFLRYFGVKMMGMPYLAPVPDGAGGLVFNWHIDAKSMAAPLQQLVAAGVFDRGPYSIHFTAGPDVDEPHDGKGLDLGHDPQSDHLVRELERRGHTIGSHGGWIHNYFGEHVTDTNEKELSPYLDWNIDAIQKLTGKPVTEYSAPLGNHPQWVSHYLEEKHIYAYYFAGDTGMGPTQVYRDSTRDGKNIWAFPIVHLGRYASLEEMGFANVDPVVIVNWLDSIADFVAEDRSARLIYTHPLGATKYIEALRQFLAHTDQLASEHRFRWYTMAELAGFLNARKKTRWAMVNRGTAILLNANSPETLDRQTWILPKSEFNEPKVRRGRVQVSSDSEHWLVNAGDCKEISVEMTRKREL